MNRVHTVQHLRASAAPPVVALHAGSRVDKALPVNVLAGLHVGHAGVDLFFVFSGYIMWSISRQGTTARADFLLRRLIRVVPPYWIATLAWVTMAYVAGLTWVSITPLHVIQSLVFIPHFNPSHAGQIWPVLVPGWTLNYEMFFYVVFAGTLLAADRFRLPILCGGLLALVVAGVVLKPGQALFFAYTSPLLLEFLGGCVVAALAARFPGSAARNTIVLLSGVVLLAWFGPSVEDKDAWSRTLGFGVQAMLITSGAVGLNGYVRRITSFERLGDASYAIYLFHLFIVTPMTMIWFALPALHSGTTAVLFILVNVVLATLLGLAVYRYLERPMQKGLNNLVFSRQRRAQLANR